MQERRVRGEGYRGRSDCGELWSSQEGKKSYGRTTRHPSSTQRKWTGVRKIEAARETKPSKKSIRVKSEKRTTASLVQRSLHSMSTGLGGSHAASTEVWVRREGETASPHNASKEVLLEKQEIRFAAGKGFIVRRDFQDGKYLSFSI